uniref:Glycosyltransferase n=1 Tax=Erigeron breviscapus TaxID=244311 RepID=A0A4D6J6N6_9ASTR|nr:UDP-glucosyltransferase UGT75L25 [Erigeron breviscapus]UZH45571.1 optimized UDP-glucosyltransferase [synthetic construct]
MTKLMDQNQPHFLLVTFPTQGHINPSLQFAKRLVRLGVKVTFATSVSAYRKMSKNGKIPDGFNFAVFSDGFDDGFNPKLHDTTVYMNQLRSKGTQSLKETILSSAENGTPVSCLVYTLLLPWAGEVAHGLNVTSTLLWIQPASVLRIYYYYFKGYNELIREKCMEPTWSIELPGLPSLKSRDLPSFCLPSNPYDYVLSLFKEQLDLLDLEDKPKVLINSFDALEEDALKEIDGKLKLIGVGPLIPSAFLDGKDPSDKSFGGDMFQKSKDYVEWMNTKPEGSIIYVSFGSLIMLSKKQKEAMAYGLLESRRPFLWVIRDKDSNIKGEKVEDDEGEEEEEELSCMEELEQLGMIVPWCSQLEVLSHPSLGCFVTHCGWNSTLESIVCGVPVVAFPHWTDQATNAKLLEDVWGTGVRVTPNEDGVVEGKEIKECIERVMGGHANGAAMRKNAKRYKDLAREAVKENGSSYTNLKDFVEEVSGSLNEVFKSEFEASV